MKETVSIPEAAKLLDVTEKTVRNYIKRGFFSPQKWNGMWQISMQEVKEVYGKKSGNMGRDNAWSGSAIDVSKDEYSEHMIGLGKLQAYEVHLKDQKNEIEKLNTRIVQLEASSASGWTQARAAQQQIQRLVDEVAGLREQEGTQREELVWLRREKDGLVQELVDQEEKNQKLVQKVKDLEDRIHLGAILE